MLQGLRHAYLTQVRYISLLTDIVRDLLMANKMYFHVVDQYMKTVGYKNLKVSVLGSDKIASVLGTNWSQRSPW